MDDAFKTIFNLLLDMLTKEGFLKGIDDKTDMPLKLTYTFLTCLRDDNNTEKTRALEFLSEECHSEQWGDIANFYLKGINCIKDEIEKRADENDDFRNRLKALALLFLSEGNHSTKEQLTAENLWSVFFHEGCNILSDRTRALDTLRNNRRIRITGLNPDPIFDPAREILFTSNVLLLAYDGKTAWANELICSGAKRISAAMDFCYRKDNGLNA